MEMKVIGHIRTCYDEKFGVPRQSGIVEQAWGELVFEPEYRKLEAVRELEGFSHIWLVFLFHKVVREKWKPTVRPPRLGGNERIGVFASRSPFRPNPIGLSAVRLEKIILDHSYGPILNLRGIDLVDGTPIIDVKPYIPYADALPDAQGGYADEVPSRLKVVWEEGVGEDLDPALRDLVEATLSADPRPAYQNEEEEREYGCSIQNHNFRWKVYRSSVHIGSCVKV